MATDDRQVLVTGKAPAPAHFLIPGNGQIRPKAITAHYDGSGAAGDFLAALKIRSDAGEFIGVYPISSPIAAGASARVSWFPCVGDTGGGAAGLPSCSCSLDIGTGDFAFGNHDLPISSFATTSPSVFSTPGGGSSLVNIGQNGFYLVAGSLSFDIAQEITQLLNLYVVQDDALGWSGALDVIANDPGHVSNVQYLHGVTFASMTATDFISAELNTEADITNVTAASLAIVQLNRTRLL